MKKVKLYLQKQYADPNNEPKIQSTGLFRTLLEVMGPQPNAYIVNKFLSYPMTDNEDDGGPSKRKSASGN